MTANLPLVPVYRSINEIPLSFGPTVAAIGNFDGVHVGHQQILQAVIKEAQTLRPQYPQIKAIAITFDPHPEQFLRPAQAPRLIVPLQERLRRLTHTGIDAILLLPFNAQLASLSARQFVEQILVHRLHICSLHEGANFRFGCQAEAGIAELAAYGNEFNFQLTVHQAVHVHDNIRTGRRGLEVSSSAIRERIATGKLAAARWMLGRSFALDSTPARGRGVGTRLLVPTVNLAPSEGLLPALGVYATCLQIAGRRFEAVTNVGNRPTFGNAGFAIESHILNFEPIDMNEQTPLTLEFFYRLRTEMEWPSPEALKAQIFKDVAKADRFFRLIHLTHPVVGINR